MTVHRAQPHTSLLAQDLLDLLQALALGLDDVELREQRRPHTEAGENPVRHALTDGVRHLLEELGDEEAEHPAAHRHRGVGGRLDVAGEELSHHRPDDGAEADVVRDDVGDQAQDRQPRDARHLALVLLHEEEVHAQWHLGYHHADRRKHQQDLPAQSVKEDKWSLDVRGSLRNMLCLC